MKKILPDTPKVFGQSARLFVSDNELLFKTILSFKIQRSKRFTRFGFVGTIIKRRFH